MSKKISSRIVFEEYISQYDTREKNTEYYFCIYKQNQMSAHGIKSQENSKSARLQHTCETSKIESALKYN